MPNYAIKLIRMTPLMLCSIGVFISNTLMAAACNDVTVSAPLPGQFLRSYYAAFKSPTRLAIDAQDNVYITDPLNHRIVVRAPSGQIISQLTDLGYPISLAVNSLNSIYVGEGNLGRVDIYDVNGDSVGFLGIGDGEFSLPSHIAVLEVSGNVYVYVVDSDADEVRRYDGVTGVFQLSFGGFGSANGKFVFPSGLAINKDRKSVV